MRIHKGFTLIELMIVVAIIGILAAVAIPAYQDYIARAQVSEAISLSSSGKTPLAEFYADKGVWPSEASEVMGSTSGQYVSAVTITTGNGVSGNLIVTARLKDTGINSAITSSTLELLTTDGGRNWNCTGGNLAAKFRPSACR